MPCMFDSYLKISIHICRIGKDDTYRKKDRINVFDFPCASRNSTDR
jgi:hypothetical protein